MRKLPAFQFYPGDWMKDPNLRSCSVAARGLWMDMLCLMFESDRRGFLQAPNGTPYSHEQLARMTGCLPDEVSRLLAELSTSGVYSRTAHGIIFSRRLKRDEEQRANQRFRQNKYAKLKKANGNADASLTGDMTKASHASSSSSSSSSSLLENSLQNSCPVAFRLPAVGGAFFDVREAQLKKWRALYLAVDVEGEVRKIIGWLDAHPSRRKTLRGTPAFVSRWLGKAQDEGRGLRNSRQGPSSSNGVLRILTRPGEEIA